MSKEQYRKARATLLKFGDVFKPVVEGLEDVAATYSASAAVAAPMMQIAEKAPDTVTGLQVRQGKSIGGKISAARHKEKHPKFLKVAAEYRARHPDHSERAVARHVAKVTGGNYETIRRVLRKKKKMG